jgi:hypothetical protein
LWLGLEVRLVEPWLIAKQESEGLVTYGVQSAKNGSMSHHNFPQEGHLDPYFL